MSGRLNAGALDGLPEDIARPRYDRAGVTPGIVHLGVGAFHRAHQAVFIDDCLNRGEHRWGIVAASLRSGATRDALAPQDNLYTYCERDGRTERLRVIGSILDVVVAPEAPHRLVEALSDPRVKLVTLTVTEKGYHADLSTGRLVADHPDILHDLGGPEVPRTIYGYLCAAIRKRRESGADPLTLLSCDNLSSNGRILHAALCDFAERRDPDLAAHIRDKIRCPCVMVDRIVPATTAADRDAVAARIGVRDDWPVVAEPYARWLIEDDFAGERPPLEHVGAEIVADLEPWEHMKLRILNGAHTAIAAIGQATGLETVDEVYAVPEVRAFIDRYWEEVIPTLRAEVNGADYAAGLRQRFANPALKHRSDQIASDASQKVPQRILAPLRELRAAGRPHRSVVLALALWLRSCAATNEAGDAIEIRDPVFQDWDAPDQNALPPEQVVPRFLEFSRVFGSERQDFEADLTAAYGAIRTHGVLGALRAHMTEA